MKKNIVFLVALAAASIGISTSAGAGVPILTSWNTKIHLVNESRQSMRCIVVSYKDSTDGRYIGPEVTAPPRDGALSSKFQAHTKDGALCFRPDDYRNKPGGRPATDSANMSGNFYARTGALPKTSVFQQVLITCRGESTIHCTVSTEGAPPPPFPRR